MEEKDVSFSVLNFIELIFKEEDKEVISFDLSLEGYEKLLFMWSVQNKGCILVKLKKGFVLI